MAPLRHLQTIRALTLSTGVLLAGWTAPARADLQICNRMSYVVEAALGVEDKGATATRGWFRVDPGQCRTVLQGAIEAERLLIHAEALPIYGAPPLPRSGHADLCVARDDFVIAAASVCTRPGQRLARFTEVKPSQSDSAQVVSLAEEAEYDDAQARLAGIQRLLVMAGYDANPIDGIQGKKTDAAIARFLKDRKLAAGAADRPEIFSALLDAAKTPDAPGFAWCNETAYAVMASLGIEHRGHIVTRGWYRVEAGRCLWPEVRGTPKRLYSYAEAVDAGGHIASRGGKTLVWGGNTILCTRNTRFELSEHADCPGMGLRAAGFAAVAPTKRGPATIRFRLP